MVSSCSTIPAERIELERTHAVDAQKKVTYLQFRVKR
jgi:hypothetical protein